MNAAGVNAPGVNAPAVNGPVVTSPGRSSQDIHVKLIARGTASGSSQEEHFAAKFPYSEVSRLDLPDMTGPFRTDIIILRQSLY